MFNKDKVRGILRARKGSQILKFAAPASPLPKPNPNILGSMAPIPKLDAITNNPIGDLRNALIKAGLEYINKKMLENKYFNAEKAASDLHKGFTDGYLSVGKDGKIKDSRPWPVSNNPGELSPLETFKLEGTNFLKQHGSLMFNMGLNALGNLFNNVENSKGVDTAFLIGDIIGNYIPQVKLLTTTFKGIDSIGGKRSREFATDLATAEQVGGSYGGSMADITTAASKSGKKYGLFSGSSRRKNNRLMDEAERLQNIMMGIADNTADLRAMINDLNYLNYDFIINGGLDWRYMRVAKLGMKLLDRIDFVKKKKLSNVINLNTKEIETNPIINEGWEPVITDVIVEFKLGGNIPKWEPVIEDLQEPVIEFEGGGKIRTLEELIKYAKELNPRFIQRLSEEPRGIKFIDNEGNEAEGSHYLESRGEYVIPRIQEVDGELKFFDEKNAVDRAIEKGNYLKMRPEEAIIFAEGYKQGWPKFFFKEVYDYYKDYDLSGVTLIRDNLARVEGNKIYVNTDEDAVHELWHFLSLNKPNEKYKEFYDNLNDDRITELGGDLNFVKRFEGDPGHFYHPSELEARIMAAKFKSQGLKYTRDFFKDLRSDESKYGYNMRDLLYMFNDDNLEKIFNLKKGGTLGEKLETPKIEETNQKNLIPEGALHKNKHHMEHTEGLTLKGIPVIDNDGELLAEIELNEIIFTLEVTKKLEELYKEGTDEAAIEAGKLLVKEILFNTDDRTGLIAKCLEGGKL